MNNKKDSSRTNQTIEKTDIEEMIGMEINKELWDKINTLIIKVGQHKELSMNELEEIMKDKVKPIIKKYKDDMRI